MKCGCIVSLYDKLQAVRMNYQLLTLKATIGRSPLVTISNFAVTSPDFRLHKLIGRSDVVLFLPTPLSTMEFYEFAASAEKTKANMSVLPRTQLVDHWLPLN